MTKATTETVVTSLNNAITIQKYMDMPKQPPEGRVSDESIVEELNTLIELVKKTEGYLYANKKHPSVSSRVAADNLSEQVNIKYRQFKEVLTTLTTAYNKGVEVGREKERQLWTAPYLSDFSSNPTPLPDDKI